MNPISLFSAAPYLVIAFLLATGGAYLKGRGDGTDLAEGQQAKEDRIALVAHEAALRVTGQAIAGIEVKNTTIRQSVEKEIHEKTIYAECSHSAVGLQLVNAALTGRTEPLSRGQLPRLDATR